jgi:hypothetical protein
MKARGANPSMPLFFVSWAGVEIPEGTAHICQA